MLGIFLAFLTALFRFISDIISKVSMDDKEMEETNYLTLSVFYRATGVPVLLFFVFITGVPEIGDKYYLVLPITIPSMIIATLIYMKALEISDISLVAPIKSISPVLLLVSGFLILGEFPDIYGLIGVLLLLCGIYTLKIEGMKKSVFEPVRKVYNDRGIQLVIIMAIIYSITAPLDKIGINASSAPFYALTLYSGGSIGLIIYHLITVGIINPKNHNVKKLSTVGVFNGFSGLTQMLALSMTLVIYVISIKRLSALMSSIYGVFFLEEGLTKARIVAAFLIVVGSVLIGLDIN